jgi:hypothetical protein
MFSIDQEMSPRMYLLNLRAEVRKQRAALIEKAPGKAVSCSLHHTVTFKAEGPEEKAILKYSMADIKDNNIQPAQYHEVELMDGGNYLYEILSDLIQAAAEDVNMKIDMFAMNAEVMYTDDIVSSVEDFITGNLVALGVDDGYAVQTTVVAGGLSQITIMVA